MATKDMFVVEIKEENDFSDWFVKIFSDEMIICFNCQKILDEKGIKCNSCEKVIIF